MTTDVMRILQNEGLICAEVVLDRDGKGFVRFEPDGDYEEVEASGDLTAAESDQLAAEIRAAVGIEPEPEVDYGGCMHSSECRCTCCSLLGKGKTKGVTDGDG